MESLWRDIGIIIVEYVPGFIHRFEADVRNKLTKRLC